MFLKDAFESLYFSILEKKAFKKEIKKVITKINKDSQKPDKEFIYHTVLESLWKQIPKQVEEYEDNDGDDYNGRPIIRYFYGCPECDLVLYHRVNYCEKCGQKLDFSHVRR